MPPERVLHRALRPSALVACLLVLPSCGDFFDKLGNSDKGYFAVAPEANLARGGWLTYVVRDYETGGPGQAGIPFALRDVTNDTAAHIRSVTPAADLVVDGLAEGSSHIDFRAVADGKTIDDGFTLTVTEVRSLGLSACYYKGGIYVRGTDGPVGYTFNPGAYPAVKGLGLYPFTLSPADAITLRTDLSTDDRWLFTIPADAPPAVVLASSLPGDTTRFTMTIVDASAVDGVYDTGTMGGIEGETTPINVMPSAGGMPVCVHALRTVTSRTPSVCLLSTDAGDVASLATADDIAHLHFVGAGACTLTMDMADFGISAAAFGTVSVSHHTSSHHDWD